MLSGGSEWPHHLPSAGLGIAILASFYLPTTACRRGPHWLQLKDPQSSFQPTARQPENQCHNLNRTYSNMPFHIRMVEHPDLQEGIGIQKLFDAFPGREPASVTLFFYFFVTAHFKGVRATFFKLFDLFLERHRTCPLCNRNWKFET
jgi:hypothetical protein